MTIFSEIIYYFLPAIMANLTPIFAAYYHILPSLDRPLDGGLSLRGQRLLGSHKTVRGLVTGVIAAAIIGLLQGNVILGAVMGFGALWGDAVKSFVKRRMNITPGARWSPWDQIDFIIGASILSFPISPQSPLVYITALLVIGLGSLLFSYVGLQLKLKTSL
jgi:CDP-2,3-bis-(O-geranylgeranyl)-sn-glycerol synthase